MKKVCWLLVCVFILASCSNSSSNYGGSYEKFKRINSNFKFHALVINSVSGIKHGGASHYSQFDANQRALQHCYGYNSSLSQHCVLNKEGDFNIIKTQIKNEEKLIQNIITKNRNICKDIGYIDETEGMADCILKLSIEDKALLEEETKQTKQKQILQDQIDRQNQINNSQAVDQFLIDLSNILTGTQPQTTRTTPSGEMCNLQRWDVQSNNKICKYYCPSGYYSKQIRNYQVCPQVVRR